MWKTIQIIFILLGFLLILGSDKLSMPVLMNAGIGSLGLAAVAIGWEAIFTRQIVVGSQRHGNRRTYSGLPAVLQGVQFNLIGLFLVGMALLLQFHVDRQGLMKQVAQHPGPALLTLAMVILTQSAVVLVGSQETRDGSRGSAAFTLLFLRLLPGLILVALGLAVTGLGFLEMTAPAAFDAMGGGLLEVLYGVR